VSAPFEPGTKVRLTGRLWDGSEFPARGTIVTIAPRPSYGFEAGYFKLEGFENTGSDGLFYVEREGHWAAEPVEPDERIQRAREVLQQYDKGEAPRSLSDQRHREYKLASALRDLLKLAEG
jgi:hypothetical protein